MILAELPRLKAALVMLGLDNGADVISDAIVPDEWEFRARLADDELRHLSAAEVETLAMGEETEQHAAAAKAPNADEVLQAAFDAGPLSEIFFTPWTSIYDARAAERRFARGED